MSHSNNPPAYEEHGSYEQQVDEKELRSPTPLEVQNSETTYLTLAWMRNGLWDTIIYPAEHRSLEEKKKWGTIPEGTKPSYSLTIGGSTMTLHSGDTSLKERGPEDPLPKPLLDIEPEGYWSTTSRYYDSESPVRRRVEMYRATKMMGLEPDSLLGCKRTFDDFDGVQYKWRTTWGDDHKCIRISDGATVARFRFHQFSFKHLGDFTVHQIVNEKTLQTLLATCGVCYELQRRRRNARYASAAGAAGGGGGGGGG